MSTRSDFSSLTALVNQALPEHSPGDRYRAAAMAESLARQFLSAGETVGDEHIAVAIRKALSADPPIGQPFPYARATALKLAGVAVEDAIEAASEQRRAEGAPQPRSRTWTAVAAKLPVSWNESRPWRNADWSGPSPLGQFMAQMVDAVSRKPDAIVRRGATTTSAQDWALETVAMMFCPPGESAAHFIPCRIRVQTPGQPDRYETAQRAIALTSHDANWAMSWIWGWLGSVSRAADAVRGGSPVRREIEHPYYAILQALIAHRKRTWDDLVEDSPQEKGRGAAA